MITGPGNKLTEGLRAGETDFVFLPTWMPQKDIVQESSARKSWFWWRRKGICRRNVCWIRKKRVVDWKKVAKLPFITLKKGHALPSSVDVLFRNADAKPDIFFESHSNMLSYRLAAQGLGVTVIPEITLELMQGGMEAEVYHLSKTPITWELSALYREGAYIGQGGAGSAGDCKVCVLEHKKVCIRKFYHKKKL